MALTRVLEDHVGSRSEFLVYLLVDEDDSISYVGRGTHGRAQSHWREDPNPELREAVDKGKVRLLVADCGSEEAMVAAEGVLISALEGRPGPHHPKNRRLDRFKFEAPRVPLELEQRSSLPVLNPKSVAELVGGPVLYVPIREGEIPYEHHFEIGPLKPDPEKIVDRMTRHWMVEPWLEDWTKDPSLAPRALVGLAGGVHDRYILGALDLEGAPLPELTGRRGTLHEISWNRPEGPLGPADIDAFGLCGRRFEGIQFKGFAWDHPRPYDSDGEAVPR